LFDAKINIIANKLCTYAQISIFSATVLFRQGTREHKKKGGPAAEDSAYPAYRTQNFSYRAY